eukprot:403476-Ditylum_brightwellii.AAC.1
MGNVAAHILCHMCGFLVVVLGGEHCGVVDGLALLGGVILWCAVGTTGRVMGAKIAIEFIAG